MRVQVYIAWRGSMRTNEAQKSNWLPNQGRETAEALCKLSLNRLLCSVCGILGVEPAEHLPEVV